MMRRPQRTEAAQRLEARTARTAAVCCIGTARKIAAALRVLRSTARGVRAV